MSAGLRWCAHLANPPDPPVADLAVPNADALQAPENPRPDGLVRQAVAAVDVQVGQPRAALREAAEAHHNPR